VQREVALLRSALASAGWEIDEAGPGQPACQLLQYNPPYAVPWLRRNEVVLRVKAKGGSDIVEDAELQVAEVAVYSDVPSDVADVAATSSPASASPAADAASPAAGPAAASPASSYLDGL
jgi:SOUL heme-binding protein